MCFADTIPRNIDQGCLTCAVFIDLRKAFDTVNHEVLLKKLRGLGVTNLEYEWFKNYLENCTQVVEFHGVLSSTESVCVGVPQGSILGLLLFILHLNDLHGVTIKCSVLMYADESVIFFQPPKYLLFSLQ